MTLEGSISDRAWPAWVWSPQDRSIVAANDQARALWNLAPRTSISGFLFPAKARVTRKLHGAAVALLAGADQVQIDIKLPFAPEETWQCRRLKTKEFGDGTLLLEAPQHAPSRTPQIPPSQVTSEPKPSIWSEDAFNALGLPVIMIAADGKILHMNEEAERLAPSDILADDTGTLWSRPYQFRDFFTAHDDVDHALNAMAEAHRTGSASLTASLMGVPGYPGGRTQIMIQRIGIGQEQAPLMITFHKLAENPAAPAKQHAALPQANQLHKEIVGLGAMAFEINEQNRVVFFTPEFADWLGKDPQDIGGKKIGDLGLTPATGAAIMQIANDTWEDGRYMIRRSDGTISTVSISSLPLPHTPSEEGTRLCLAKSRDAIATTPSPTPSLDGLTIGSELGDVLAIFEEGVPTDKTGEQSDNLVRLDDWREGDEIVLTGGSFRALIDTLDAALLGLDKDGKIQFVNAAVETLLGQPAAKLEGKPFASCFRAVSGAKLAQLFTDTDKEHEAFLEKSLSLEPRNAASRNDTLVLKLHKLRERSPIRYCAFLKPENQRRTSDAKDNIPGAPSAVKKRTDFVARMSHEIRTPLNAILGFSDLILSEGLGPIGNEKYKEYMQDIHDSGHLILSLINDILDLAKVEAEGISVELKGLNLETRIRQAVSILSAQAEAKSLALSVEIAEPLPIIFADDRSVMQILLNLLSNAIKFTGKSGAVRISAEPHDKDHVKLVVEDTGIGMTTEDLKRALTPFQQSSAAANGQTSETVAGTGLGLPITQALSEANNAAFRIQSERNKGTRVEILFNRARAAAE